MDTLRDPHSPAFSLSPEDLNARLQSGGSAPPLLLDVRHEAAFAASDRVITGAVRCAPEDVATFAAGRAPGEVVAYCRYGHELGCEAAERLRAAGWQATFLEGGIEGGEDGVDAPADIARWRAARLPTTPKPHGGLPS